ncbi:MAG TPA: hemolysin family protein [Longimicrobiales bacterium]|nr:hemolysin family protein [Longimicrobiales bacterium]
MKLVAVLALIGINAFFVAAEFALISARRSRVEPLARSGHRGAQRVLAAMEAPEPVVAASQLGIVLATIAIGWIAQSGVYGIIHPQLAPLAAGAGGDAAALSRVLATVAAVALVVFVHVVLGEQVPKLLATQDPERIAFRTTGPAQVFTILLSPVTRLASFVSAAVVRLFGGRPSALPSMADTHEEIRHLVEQSHQEGNAESDQEQMLLGVIQFRDTLAREVMTPRRDIIALPVTATRAETLALAMEEGHSRIPIYAESMDDIIGVLLVKDLLTQLTRDESEAEFDLSKLMREPYFVPDTKRIGELLPELRTKSVHMAIVLDEFGGTDGLVTLEDMLEEIVGDIYDEHDIPEEETDFEVTPSGDVLIDGSASIFDVNEHFGLSLPEQDYDTIGGFIFGELGRVPVAGDVVAIDGARELYVQEVEERRVTRVRLMPLAPVPQEEGDTGGGAPS